MGLSRRDLILRVSAMCFVAVAFSMLHPWFFGDDPNVPWGYGSFWAAFGALLIEARHLRVPRMVNAGQGGDV